MGLANYEGGKENINQIPNDLPKNINIGQQGKHIPEHNNFIPGRSTINEGINTQSLLDGIHSEQYPIIGKGSRGQPIVDFGKPIGTDASSGMSTQYVQFTMVKMVYILFLRTLQS
ncbi:polymorphic toxin type 50 domain-containing protein [Bombiscardovia apis]|uniref:polymorphic toxin type 50 domain-containing protein n=1 Tax=Bombiscardovia apis TaxID=2932182 RepID=UPI002953A6E2|nr:polymorphic toxin type 50 domain-containing protein [Bombiscardovia apis]